MDFNNIEEFLRSGGTPDQIAKEFTDRLNKAIDVIEEEKEYKKKIKSVAETWNDFVNSYFKTHKLPENCSVVNFYILEEDVVAIIEMFVKVAPFIGKSAIILDLLTNKKEEVEKIFNEKCFADIIEELRNI